MRSWTDAVRGRLECRPWRYPSSSGEDRIAHIGRHNVEPEEFEEICFGKALVLQSKSQGKNPVHYVLGQTEAGRHLFCVVISFPDGKGYPVTAREMTDGEKQRYAGWKKA